MMLPMSNGDVVRVLAVSGPGSSRIRAILPSGNSDAYVPAHSVPSPRLRTITSQNIRVPAARGYATAASSLSSVDTSPKVRVPPPVRITTQFLGGIPGVRRKYSRRMGYTELGFPGHTATLTSLGLHTPTLPSTATTTLSSASNNNQQNNNKNPYTIRHVYIVKMMPPSTNSEETAKESKENKEREREKPGYDETEVGGVYSSSYHRPTKVLRGGHGITFYDSGKDYMEGNSRPKQQTQVIILPPPLHPESTVVKVEKGEYDDRRYITKERDRSASMIKEKRTHSQTWKAHPEVMVIRTEGHGQPVVEHSNHNINQQHTYIADAQLVTPINLDYY